MNDLFLYSIIYFYCKILSALSPRDCFKFALKSSPPYTPQDKSLSGQRLFSKTS